jgi:hypothetical protein
MDFLQSRGGRLPSPLCRGRPKFGAGEIDEPLELSLRVSPRDPATRFGSSSFAAATALR